MPQLSCERFPVRHDKSYKQMSAQAYKDCVREEDYIVNRFLWKYYNILIRPVIFQATDKNYENPVTSGNNMLFYYNSFGDFLQHIPSDINCMINKMLTCPKYQCSTGELAMTITSNNYLYSYTKSGVHPKQN